jgi:hypothetical protein
MQFITIFHQGSKRCLARMASKQVSVCAVIHRTPFEVPSEESPQIPLNTHQQKRKYHIYLNDESVFRRGKAYIVINTSYILRIQSPNFRTYYECLFRENKKKHSLMLLYGVNWLVLELGNSFI